MEKEINKILGDLLIQLAQKNMGALDEIHHLVGKALYAIVNKFFYQKADIEDTIHDLYYLISKKAHKYKPGSNACAWLTTIFKNLAKNRLKKEKRICSLTELTAMRSRVWMNEEDRDYLEHHLLINEIFRQLNSYEKDLIIYHFWFRFSYSEIAKMYNKPKSTISSQISRLEERLRKIYKKE